MTYKYNPFWQQRIRETVRHALNVHPRLTALRVDLRFPDVPAATDAAVISRFINALKARIDAYQKRKHREGKRVHPTTLHYVWAREFGECKGKKHYHLMLLVNRDTWCRAGDYRAPESLAGMIKQAWCSALGVDVGCHATLVHFPAWPAVWLARNDDTGFQQVLERADYLAKEHTKAHCTGERNSLQRGNDGQPPWFEHDQMTVAEKILLRCTWLDPAEKEARRLHLQGMTVPDYTVKVRKWFCVMCDEDYEGEKCCPRCGTGVYSREGGLQEGNWKDRN
ncbi:inovirus-type Gp2 protein [Escherichia coli]